MTDYRTIGKNVLLPAAILLASALIVIIVFSSPNTNAIILKTGPAPVSVGDNNYSVLQNSDASQALAQPTTLDMSLPDLFSKTQASVVQITDSSATEPTTLGSGFIYDGQGHVATNYHVVSSGGSTARLDVTFLDGTIYRAKLVGFDAGSDLAILSIDNVPKDKLVPLVLANSSNIRVGEQVAAIGNPFGLSGSMTEGIVSGLGRLIPADSGSQNNGNSPGYSIPDVIQTDAPINPGNSGGPLLSMNGHVIGINTAIYSTTGVYSGVGFAIPSNTIARVVPSLISTGSYKHPWLGISGTDVTPDIADALKLKEPRGFLVADVVTGGPADKAGIHGGGGDTTSTIGGRQVPLGGDVILGIDGKPVRKIDDILVYLEGSKTVGDGITLSVMRNGSMIDIHVVLGVRPRLSESP